MIVRSAALCFMPKTYKNSPIVEAVLELQLEGSPSYDQASIQKFFEAIRHLFPEKKKGKRNQVEIKIKEEQIDNKISEFDIFFSEDKKYLLQLEDNRLSIHRLAPYISWGSFLPVIEDVLTAYKEILNHRELGRIGLRYVNKINTKDNSAEVFNLNYVLPTRLKGLVSSGFSNFELKINDKGDRVVVRVGDKEDQLKNVAHILDIDYSNKEIKLDNKNEIIVWTNQAHVIIEQVFEELVMEEIKKTFDK